MCIHVCKHGVHSGQLEAAILELKERRLVIISRVAYALAGHEQRTRLKNVGECVGECLREVAVCVLILFVVFIEWKKLEI